MEFAFEDEVITKSGPAASKRASAQTIQFKSSISKASNNIDRETRTIDNVILATVGEAKGHDVEVEQSFVEDLVNYADKKMSNRVQCNYGHRYNNLGFALGFFSDVRMSGKKAIATLQLYKSADNAPEVKGMASYCLDMAEEDPKSIMCSIKFIPKHYYQYDEKGQKVIIQYSWWMGPIKAFEDKPAYVAFDRLISCDIVDDGALTESLFSSGDDYAQQFYDMVNAPDFMEFMKDNHQHFPALRQFYRDNMQFSIGKMFTSIFSKNPKDNNPKPMSTESKTDSPVSESPKQFDEAALNAAIDARIKDAVTPLQTKIDEQAQELSKKDQQITELKKNPVVAAAATKTEDQQGDEGEDPTAAFMNSPMNRRVSRIINGK